jgi:hypothetical protein
MASNRARKTVNNARQIDARGTVIKTTEWDGKTPIWSFGILDIGHNKWCWGKMAPDKLVEVLGKLKNFEQLLWGDIFKAGSHDVQVSDIIKEANDRLVELSLDDMAELYSLRLSGKERIYGIKEGGILRIIWWDPNHEICPSKKKHT